MVENQNIQRKQSGVDSESSPIPVPSEVRRIVSAMPELGISPQKELNDVLELDNCKNAPRTEEDLSSHISQNQQDIEPIILSENTELRPEHYIDVFTEINIFQVGIIKPEKEASQSACFVPVFPFMYEDLDYGELIVDTRNTISLHLLPETAKRVQ